MARLGSWVGVMLFVAAAGCGTVRLTVPEGREVRLLQSDEPASIRVKRTVWFWLWGNNPISDNTTEQDILEYDLCEVRIQSENTFLEALTNPITAVFSFVRRTLVVEGNPRPTTQEPVEGEAP